MEDQPLSSPQAYGNTEVSCPTDAVCYQNDEDAVEVQKEPALEPERPIPTIDDHIEFWSTYDKVSGAFDREFIDAWNKSLDVLLIFAGLFSAINTAFIIESYKGLQPDPAETTNALLRLLILHRNDNVTLSIEDLNPGFPASLAAPLNSIFFSSLSFSLTAAFGAVTAKQWLSEYTNAGALKAFHLQGRMRQQKYKGLQTWHLRLIIELLPMLLQISLLLFLVGTVLFLWTLDRKVATIQLIISGFGVATYFVTLVIGIVFPTSPFRTPLTIYIPWYFSRVLHSIKALLSTLDLGGPIGLVAAGILRWINRSTPAFNKVSIPKAIRGLIAQSMALTSQTGYTDTGDSADSKTVGMDCKQWAPEDIIAAESVVWILEHAEHPDVTITALDALSQLPSDLMFSLIRKHEGLLERLIQFHKSLLPPLQDGMLNGHWMENWPNRAIVSGVALWHILKVKGFKHGDLNAASLNIIDFDFPEADNDPLIATKFYLTHNHLMFPGIHWPRYLWKVEQFHSGPSSLIGSSTLVVELTDTRQSSTVNTLSTSISPLSLHLDAMIHFACGVYDKDINPYRDRFSHHLRVLSSQMSQCELPRAIVSHIAIATAALHWRFKVNEPWSYPSIADQHKFEHTLSSRFYSANKTEALVENVAMALSVVDVSCLDLSMFRVLFTATALSLEAKVEDESFLLSYPNFVQSLLRLLRHFPDDLTLQSWIGVVLGGCSPSHWVSPLREGFERDISKLICSILSSKNSDFLDGPHDVLNNMARALEDKTQLLHMMHSGSMEFFQYYTAIADNIRTYEQPFAEDFTAEVLKLDGLEGGLLEVQISFVVAILSGRCWNQGSHGHSIALFFNRILKDQTGLHWPAYFVSAGIVSLANHNATSENAADLKFIDPSDFADCFREALEGTINAYKGYTLFGEALLLLWKKGKQERANGGLPLDWSDNIFFHDQTVAAMLDFFACVCEQAYAGMNQDLLREYFTRALAGTDYPEGLDYATEDSNPGSYEDSPRQIQRNRRTALEAALKTLDGDPQSI